jgi:hypothetical protein
MLSPPKQNLVTTELQYHKAWLKCFDESESMFIMAHIYIGNCFKWQAYLRYIVDIKAVEAISFVFVQLMT